MLDEPARARLSPELDKARESRRDENRAIRRLTVARHVVQRAG